MKHGGGGGGGLDKFTTYTLYFAVAMLVLYGTGTLSKFFDALPNLTVHLH